MVAGSVTLESSRSHGNDDWNMAPVSWQIGDNVSEEFAASTFKAGNEIARDEIGKETGRDDVIDTPASDLRINLCSFHSAP